MNLSTKNNKKTYAVLAALTFLLSACSTFFDKDNTPTPTPLPIIKPEIIPKLRWSTHIGKGATGYDYLKLAPSVTETSVFTVSSTGTVTAINKFNGAKRWERNTGLHISSSAGTGNGIIVIGGQHGEIWALQQSNGCQLWRTSIPGEVIATPAVQNGYVIIKAVDGYTRALSSRDGHEIWSSQQIEPTLILRGSSAPIIHEHQVIVGYANGNITKLNLDDGQPLWSQVAAIPEGAFAIQRMIDIDADPIIFDHRIYVATYQGRISSLDWISGRTIWTHDISSYTGMSATADSIYITDTRGLVWSFNTDNGFINWRQNKLEYRILSGPASMGDYVVVGDAQGYLHWLSKQDGHFVGRASLGSAIYAAPIINDGVLYVLTNKGYLAAYTF